MGERSNIGRAGGAGAATTAHDDAAGRLSTFAHALVGAGNVAWTFGYSPANQLTASTATNDSYSFRPATTLKTYVANGLNQYPSVSGTAYAYDGRGNLTSDGARAFTYDLENHLLSASAPTAVTMAYDPLGRLQSTTAGGAATNLLYDGSNLVGEYDGAGNILRRYAFGANVDEPVTWYEGAGVAGRRWLHADRQGSTIAWSDASGNLGWFRGYGPYGEPNTWAGSRFAYTGQAMVPEAQLYYYKSRFYDPGIGRFLQVDTVGYASDVNSYAYAHGDPLDRTDASGTDDLWVIGKLQMKFQELQNLINLFSKLKDVVSITPNLDAIASGQNGKKPDKSRQEKRKRGDFCQTLDRKVNETKNNLSDYETGSWRWNSSVALSYDLEVNNARLAEDTLAADSLGIASVATGPASGAIRPVGAALASPGGIAVVAAAGSFGVASGLDAEKRQSEIDALQNRIDQLEAQSAGICRK